MDQCGNFCTNSDDIKVNFGPQKSIRIYTAKRKFQIFAILPLGKLTSWFVPYIFYYFKLMFPNFSVFVIYSLACNVKKGKYKLVNYL